MMIQEMNSSIKKLGSIILQSINLIKKIILSKLSYKNNAFTLVELLVVIVIIGILLSIMLPALGTISNRSRQKSSLAEIQEISMALSMYEQEYRDYPPTDLTQLGLSRHNQINSGIECVVACLSANKNNGQPFFSFSDRKLENSDSDISSIPLRQLTKSTFPRNDLWEIMDPWNTPYIYFHNRDINETIKVDYKISGQKVKVSPNLQRSKTGQIRNLGTFQLFSCGTDGIPLNEDDVIMN